MSLPILVVYNPQSGSGDDSEALREAIVRAGLRAEKFMALGDETLQALRGLVATSDYVVIAAGGDGTVSAVASILAGSKSVLGVVPQGTLNHFAQDAKVPGDLDEALAVISGGRSRIIDTASVNDLTFLNNSSIGIYPEIVRLRERHESKVGKWPAAAWATLKVLRSVRRIHLTMTIDEKEIVRRSPFVFVGNNSYQIDKLGFTNRKSLSEGRLCVYLLRSQTLVSIFRVIVRTSLGTAGNEEDFEEYYPKKLVISSILSSIDVACDGEVRRLETPLTYLSEPKSLNILALSGD